MTFKPVDPQVSFPELEERTIKYWKTNKIFEKSIKNRPKDKAWTFLDGPPFITGMPHYGTLLSSIPKDLFGRYWTMKGYRVRRVWGWDCHGLPAENKVENKLGLKTKKEIEQKLGIKKFIEECKLYVSEVSSEWEWYVDRIGRWVDFKNAYKTMDKDYMETVMWIFKQIYDQGLIYKGLRVSLYCPHCVTPISNFEVAMDADNYKDVTESATTYKYQLQDQPGTYFLAWSTTPWNKLATPALAVNPKLDYVKVQQGSEKYILAKTTLKILSNNPKPKIINTFKGQKLIGAKFTPHYNFYKIEPGKQAFQIIPGNFVTADEGTGIVTIAAYGEDDLKVMQEQNIQIVLHVDEEGHLLKKVPKWGGEYYLKVNKLVNQDLADRELIYKDEPYTHRVPTCWRCHTRLFHSPQNAWFINIQKLKNQLKKTNEAINWFPEHFKHGRFFNSLESAPDWCISRSRYWGSPVPVWECECGERYVPGSIKDLEELSEQKITDLHKPEIDKITIKCRKCGKAAHRVPEVLDSWTEAGSASFAERHFPFSGDQLKDFFPPDFIVEYTGQIRAWFYVLHVIANAIYKSHAFKNVVVTGVILGTDGRKMSKNFGNYPDPKEMLQKYGADALRLYLMGSPVMKGEDIIISEDDYSLWSKQFLRILWNCYNFFITYANVDGWKSNKVELSAESSTLNILDQWILSRLHNNLKNTTQALEKYDTKEACDLVLTFIDDFSRWYIRSSRNRVGPTATDEQDKQNFYQTCYLVLTTFCKQIAPLAPFITEEIYTNLTGEQSVHLADWPNSKAELSAKSVALIENMHLVRQIVERGHAARREVNINVRQPLAKMAITLSSKPLNSLKPAYEHLILDELNIKEIEWQTTPSPPSEGGARGGHLDKNTNNLPDLTVHLDTTITPALKAEGQARVIIRQIQIARKEANCELTQKVTVQLPDWPTEFEDLIKHQTLAKKIVKGKQIQIIK